MLHGLLNHKELIHTVQYQACTKYNLQLLYNYNLSTLIIISTHYSYHSVIEDYITSCMFQVISYYNNENYKNAIIYIYLLQVYSSNIIKKFTLHNRKQQQKSQQILKIACYGNVGRLPAADV